jgi:hypothetical protein
LVQLAELVRIHDCASEFYANFHFVLLLSNCEKNVAYTAAVG